MLRGTIGTSEFESVRIELMGGARQIEADTGYKGVWYKRQDGSIFGLRLSTGHGLTLDVIQSNHPQRLPDGFRIHQR
jgi:filamentous hemagglutinin